MVNSPIVNRPIYRSYKKNVRESPSTFSHTLIKQLLNKNDTVIISISNRISKPVKIVNGMIQTSKSDKENHGIGLNNIMTIVKKYDGDARMRYKDGWFYYTAIL